MSKKGVFWNTAIGKISGAVLEESLSFRHGPGYFFYGERGRGNNVSTRISWWETGPV